MRDFITLLGLTLLAVSMLTILASAFVLIWTYFPVENTVVLRLFLSSILTSFCSVFLISVSVE